MSAGLPPRSPPTRRTSRLPHAAFPFSRRRSSATLPGCAEWPPTRSGRRLRRGEVRGDVDALLRRVRTLHRLSNALMLDAYERDIGGD